MHIPTFRTDRHNTDDRSRQRVDSRPPLFVLAGALLCYYLRFGYDYAHSDQDEFIPYLLHRLDPALFAEDWLVRIQATEFSVRTYFVWLVQACSAIVPIWLAVLVLYAVCWLCIAWAVWKIAWYFTADRLVASGAVFVTLVATPVWTLGGNDLVHSMLVPSMAGWALGSLAIYLFLKSRPLAAAALLGVTCWMHALVGLQLAALLCIIQFLAWVQERKRPLRSLAAFALVFAACALPTLGPIFYQQVLATTPQEADPSLFYIMAEFRNPHHYLPGSFHAKRMLGFALIAGAGFAALAWQPLRQQLHHKKLLLRILAAIAGFCVAGWIFTEIIPVLAITKLQLFKTTVLAKVLLVIVAGSAASALLPHGIRRMLHVFLRHERIGTIAVVAAWGAAMVLTLPENGYLHNHVGPWQRAAAPIGAVQKWVQTHTPHDATFATPPSLSSFRSEAQRAIVVNHKAIPFTDRHMITWFERLTDLAPVGRPERGAPGLLHRLDTAFESLTERQLVELGQQYEFRHVLRSTPLPEPLSAFRQVFTAENLFVYERSDHRESNKPDTSKPATGSSDHPDESNRSGKSRGVRSPSPADSNATI